MTMFRRLRPGVEGIGSTPISAFVLIVLSLVVARSVSLALHEDKPKVKHQPRHKEVRVNGKLIASSALETVWAIGTGVVAVSFPPSPEPTKRRLRRVGFRGRMPRSCCLPDHPVTVDPPVRGAGQALGVNVERPTGRTTLTSRAWSARLARVDGDGTIKPPPSRSPSAPPEALQLKTVGGQDLPSLTPIGFRTRMNHRVIRPEPFS
jgi:hypothetical protein